MLYDYIKENYENGEPIFISELPGNSKDYIRQEMKKLADEGKIERVFKGVYLLPYKTILGTAGKMSFEKYINKRFINTNNEISGYFTGIQLANMYGFTTQNPAQIEICSNEASTKQRKLDIIGRSIIVYQPPVKITKDNVSSLQFLDMMTTIDKYSELKNDALKRRLQEFIKITKVDFNLVKKYLPYYPDKTYRNLYEGGIMHELV